MHAALGARFTEVNGREAVSDYGGAPAEHAALRSAAGVMDLGFRGRVCLTGADRVRFLNGQVTNNVKDLRDGEGCYAALITAKGRLESNLNIFRLPGEILLDFEPGLTPTVTQRLEKYIIADDVQVVDVAPQYGLLSVQGPAAAAVVSGLALPVALPEKPLAFASFNGPTLGEIHLAQNARLGLAGFDLFVPAPALGAVMDKLVASAALSGVARAAGRLGKWRASKLGIPRFGADMDETNLAPDTRS